MKNNKGITLIALVITIIILLILAAVTIFLLIGKNGLINRAVNAKDLTEQARLEEAEALEKVDKYIQDTVDGDETDDGISKFENNGIDKSHDGARYDEVTTDDGMWTIYKDIDTETRKVNVYVASKYYRPSFEEYVAEKYYLNTILYSYALPVYSFSDLTDAVSIFIARNCSESEEEFFNMLDQENVKKRKEEMGIGIILSDIFENMGVDEYDVFTEVGKKLVKQLQANEERLSVSSGEAAEINGTDWGKILGDVYEYEDAGQCYGPELNYSNLLNSYNKLYGNKANLNIPETEKNNTYRIELPDGTVEEIRGDELYKAKVRYITTKNGDISIKISSNTSEAKTINYTGVTNIGTCMYEEGEYLYTYNCLPMIDDFSGLIAEFSALAGGDAGSLKYDRSDSMIYRFNLGGWNVICSEVIKAYENNFEGYNDPYNEEGIGAIVEEKVKDSINGKPVTSFVNTFFGVKIGVNALYIPSSVKYMFSSLRAAIFQKGLESFNIPNTIDYASHVVQKGKSEYENFILRVPKSIAGHSPNFGNGDHGTTYNVETY